MLSVPNLPVMCGGKQVVQRVLLPKNVKPLGYKVHLTPDMKSCEYKGEVSTSLVVLTATPENTITFHSMELVIDFANVKLERHGSTVTASAHHINTDDEMTSVTFPGTPFVVGEALTLIVPFHNKLNDEMAGFYRSKYQVNGEDRCALFVYLSQPILLHVFRKRPLSHISPSANNYNLIKLALNLDLCWQVDRHDSIRAG